MKKLFLITIVIIASLVNANAAKSVFLHSNYKIVSKADEGVKIQLIIGNKTYDIIMYNLNYVAPDKTKSSNNNEVPGIFPYNQASSLNVTIRSTKVDRGFMDWILSPDSSPKDGQIIITDNDSGKTLKTITFTGLTPAVYSENLSNNGFNVNIQPTVSFNMRFKAINIKL